MTSEDLQQAGIRWAVMGPRMSEAEHAARALIYTRVSTKEQADQGLSLDAQAARCTAYCEQKGWAVEGVIRDTVSGAVALFDRPGGQQVLDGPVVDRLVIARLDRLCRDTHDFLGLVERFANAGIGIVALDLGVDLATPEGRLFHTLVVSFAEYERGVLRRRTQSGMDRARQLGKHCGRAPYGWRNTGAGDLSAATEEQITIARMAALRLDGLSYQKVANALQVDGPGKRGGSWTAGTVRTILKRECEAHGDRVAATGL